MTGAGLECRGVTVAPGGAPILRGVDLAIAGGRRVALVGPSGAGKTTLLRAIAGLAPLAAGEILLDGVRLDVLAPHRRPLAVVFQEPRLLPHLDVLDNVAFPLRAAGVGRRERRARARALVDEVGLAALASGRVTSLSGGEQQRVALARALCAEPLLLLLDEPLAAVDPNRREELRRLIVRVQRERGLTALAITHDRAEAAELGERIAVMLEGRVVQHDRPETLFERPASAAVARFFGIRNLLRGTVLDGLLAMGSDAVGVPGPDGPATFAIRPEHVALGAGGALGGRVAEAIYAGSHVRLTLAWGEASIEAHVPPADAPPAGADVRFDLPAEHLWRLPGEAGVTA